MAQYLIQIQGYLLAFDQRLHFSFGVSWKESHHGLGSKSVFCSLFVISLRHITKHNMCSLVDIMDDLAHISLEILGSKTLKVSKSSWRYISLPLKIAFSSFNETSQTCIFLLELGKGLTSVNLQA